MENDIEDIIKDIEIPGENKYPKITLPKPPEATEVIPKMSEPTTFEKAKAGYKNRQAVVAYIIAMPGCTQKEISDHLNINTGFVSHIVRDLEKKGLVKRNDRQVYFFNQAIPGRAPVAPSRPYVRKSIPKPTGERKPNEMTTQEYADKHGINRFMVQLCLKTGRLKGRKIPHPKGRHGHASGMWVLADQPCSAKSYMPKSTRSENCRKARMRMPAKRRREIAIKANQARKCAKKKGFFSKLFGG